MVKRVAQRLEPEVQHVIVGERDTVDADVGEPLGRHRWSAEIEPLAELANALAPSRDAALEVRDEQVRSGRELLKIPGQQSVTLTGNAHADLAAEHRVASQRHRHRHTPDGTRSRRPVRARGPRPATRW